MTEETEQKETDPAAEPGGSGAKFLLVAIIVGTLLVLGAMGGGMLMLMNKAAALRGTGAAARPAAPAREAKPPSAPHAFALDTFIVPLAAPDSDRFLRVSLALEPAKAADLAVFRQNLPRIRAAILAILPRKNLAQIATAAGKAALKEEILAALRRALPGASVSNLYFTEFVVE